MSTINCWEMTKETDPSVNVFINRNSESFHKKTFGALLLVEMMIVSVMLRVKYVLS